MPILGAALQGGSRHFSYVDRLTPTLRPYDLFVAPLVAIEGEIYPFVELGAPRPPGLGAIGSYARAFGLASRTATGTNVSTSWQAFAIGLRERLPIGTCFILGIDAGYGDTSFEFDDPIRADRAAPQRPLQVPPRRSRRPPGQGRPLRSRRARATSTSCRPATWQRSSRASPSAASRRRWASPTRSRPAVELSLDLDYTRFFYSLLPQPGDTYVAGGALDQMATISLGVAYLF